MSAAAPCKTAPRLIEDLLRYDPAVFPTDAQNVLISAGPQAEGETLPDANNSNGCRHKFMLKPDQSVLPPVNAISSTPKSYMVASFCTECRCHLDLSLEIEATTPNATPCPNTAYPLHHFQYLPEKSKALQNPTGSNGGPRWQDERHFRCSSEACCAVVIISIRPSRLSPEHLATLTDPARIKARIQPALESDPDRLRGYTVPEPIKVLSNLRQYLIDALRTTEVKKVNATNKPFMTSLGNSCGGLLEYLGFRYSEESTETEVRQFWALPSIQRCDNGPVLQDSASILVDDVDKELMVLMDKRSWAEKTKANKVLSFTPLPALIHIERCLDTVDYAKLPSSRHLVDLTTDDHPCYSTLGALEDFSDDLIEFAYDRQRLCDPDQAAHYFDCLKRLADFRHSDSLSTKAVVMESTGEISTGDIEEAYTYFKIDPHHRAILNDEHVLGVFKSRVAAAPTHENQARHHLQIIGKARRSSFLELAASERINTNAQALVWLGAEGTTADEFIISLYTSKIEEGAEAQVARRAVECIAAHRNSPFLRSWLDNGSFAEIEMDVGQAYTRLGMEDRTLDDDMILALFDIRVSEAPAQNDDLRAALRAIGKEKGSQKIAAFLQTGQTSGQVSAEWPVGLENIGNTCYLNSLLQFYFTVAPLRQLILDFDKFATEVTPESVHRKRVGSRKVTLKEIERAKKFAYELQRLFQSLITAKTTSITPERELARLTLIKASDEETFRRMSITSAHERPDPGYRDRGSGQGPIQPQPGLMSEITESEPAELDRDDHKRTEASDDASDVTLVDRPWDDQDIVTQKLAHQVPLTQPEHAFSNEIKADDQAKGQQRQILEDKENLAPSKEEAARDIPNQEQGTPLHEVSGSRANQQGVTTTDTLTVIEGTPLDIDSSLPMQVSAISKPPDRRPPVPPRPTTEESRPKPVDELELGAQQDVTEVIGNVLFQLECAMRPLSIERGGEQYDEIKQMFYGKVKVRNEAGNARRENVEAFADIKINVSSGSRDIYSALDEAFDVQEVILDDGVFQQYSSITHLPPVLQVFVQRVQFDKEKSRTYKSESHLGLRETIYMDRYMDSEDTPLLTKRRETWRWKHQLSLLQGRHALLTKTKMDLSIPELFGKTKEWLASLDVKQMEGIDPVEADLMEDLTRISVEADKELSDIEASMAELTRRLESQFSDATSLPYRLQSVFIHRGTATFGHYWIYIYDFKRQIWRKYNDGYVTEVTNMHEIFEQDPSHPATPYYLVYVREEELERLVDPVCRDIPEEPDMAMEIESDGSGAPQGNDVPWIEEAPRPHVPVDANRDVEW
ncbi:MAG: ubiquitin-specific protease ubp2 [Caeruleum heppii]|nr:MAG: ubiquitin-specific protease ubp2 [Caeruleum heppii]